MFKPSVACVVFLIVGVLLLLRQNRQDKDTKESLANAVVVTIVFGALVMAFSPSAIDNRPSMAEQLFSE